MGNRKAAPSVPFYSTEIRALAEKEFYNRFIHTGNENQDTSGLSLVPTLQLI